MTDTAYFFFQTLSPEEQKRLREVLRAKGPRGTDPTPGGAAGVPVRRAEHTTVRAIGGFVQTSERFVGKSF